MAGVGHGRRVARAVGQQHPVGFEGENVVGAEAGGHHRDPGDRLKVSEQAALDSVIHRHHPARAARKYVGLRRGDHTGQVGVVGSQRARGGGTHLGLRCGAERAGHRAVVTQVPGQPAGIHPGDPRDAVPLQPILQARLGPPAAVAPGQIAHHHTGAPRSWRFVIGTGRAIVTDVWIGERHDLSGVAGVRQHLLITRKHGVEHHLTGADSAFGPGTDRLALKERSVAQHQCCLGHAHASPPSSFHPSAGWVPPDTVPADGAAPGTSAGRRGAPTGRRLSVGPRRRSPQARRHTPCDAPGR